MGPKVASAKLPSDEMTATEIKLFNKYTFDDVQVQDMALTDYIACKPQSACFLPHSAGRWHKKRFKKAQCPIIERITNSLMMHGELHPHRHYCTLTNKIENKQTARNPDTLRHSLANSTVSHDRACMSSMAAAPFLHWRTSPQGCPRERQRF